MKFFSLNKTAPVASFKEATIKGLAPDKGLYFPEIIPKHEAGFYADIQNYSNEEIAFKIIEPYVAMKFLMKN